MYNEQYPKALVIDDEALVSVLIEDILRARGYEVTVVNTRSQLLEATAHHHFALAVSDTDLASPAEMRAWNVDHLVICSGKPRVALEEEFPGLPYILKPFSERDFDEVLRRRLATFLD